jgi:hypothetical protein
LRGFKCPDGSELARRPLSVRESLWGEREGELGEYLPENFFVITMGFHFDVKVNWNYEVKSPMTAWFSSLPPSTSLAFAEWACGKKMCVPEPLLELSFFFQCAPAKIV